MNQQVVDFSFPDLNLQLDGQLPINFNSVVIDNIAMLPSIENLPGFEARAAFLCHDKALRGNPVNSAETIARYFFYNSRIIRKFAL